jgi:HK97 family phage portal protein
MFLSNGVFRSVNVPAAALAETAPQISGAAYFAPRTGIALQQQVATYGLMYRVQPHLFTAIDKIANLVAKLSVGVYDTSPETGDKLDRTGPYAKLMKAPAMDMPTFKFYHWLSTTYEIYGEAYLLKLRAPTFDGSRGRITGFAPMHPANTYIHRCNEDCEHLGTQAGSLMYGFTGAPNMWYPESEIVPFRRYNPDNRMRGLSRMEPLRQTLMNEDSLRKAAKSLSDNMLRPSFVLSTPKTLGDAGFQRLEAAIQASSGADNAGNVMLLEDDVTATRMQLDAEEMQYIETRKLHRDECFEVYDLNPAAAQINDNTTATSYGPMTKDVYKSSIDHRLRDFESTFDFYVGCEYNSPKEFRFEVNNQLRADIELLAPAIVQLVQTFVLKPSEARVWLGMSDAGTDADQLMGNSAMTTLKLLLNPPEPPKPVGGLELPSGNPSHNGNPNPMGDQPKVLPALTDKAKEYKNRIFSGLGRGKEWSEVAHTLMDRNPADRQDIQVACMHILVEGKV